MALVLLSSSGLVCADFEIGGHFVETAQSSAISPRTGWWAAPVHSKNIRNQNQKNVRMFVPSGNSLAPCSPPPTRVLVPRLFMP